MKKFFVLLLALLLMLIVGCSNTDGGKKTPNSGNDFPTSTYPNAPYGLNFGPYVDGSNPDYGAIPTVEQVSHLLDTLKPFTVWIRTYTCSPLKDSNDSIASLAHKKGFKVAGGCWLSKDTVANAREINYLMNEIYKGNIDLAIVGSEVIYRNDLTISELMVYVRMVKAAGKPVAIDDTASAILNNSSAMAEADEIMVNIYPYWENVDIDNAFSSFLATYNAVQAKFPGRDIVVGETGWPSDNRSAVANIANAVKYIDQILNWSNALGKRCFPFEAFDEPWKVANEGLIGAHWGLWTKDGVLKPGMLEVFKKQPVYNPVILPGVSLADASFSEGSVDYVVEVPVSISEAVNRTVSVSYATSDLTAKAGIDYVAANGTLTIPAGSKTGKILLMIKGNLTQNEDKSFRLTLSNPIGAIILIGQATITITDDDRPLELTYTFCPKIGESSDLQGKCYGLNPADYAISVYIRVGSGYWTKPTWASPITTIKPDGSWSCDITTGGIDGSANQVAIFLIRAGYSPPSASGGALPQGVIDNAIKSIFIDRTKL